MRRPNGASNVRLLKTRHAASAVPRALSLFPLLLLVERLRLRASVVSALRPARDRYTPTARRVRGLAARSPRARAALLQPPATTGSSTTQQINSASCSLNGVVLAATLDRLPMLHAHVTCGGGAFTGPPELRLSSAPTGINRLARLAHQGRQSDTLDRLHGPRRLRRGRRRRLRRRKRLLGLASRSSRARHVTRAELMHCYCNSCCAK